MLTDDALVVTAAAVGAIGPPLLTLDVALFDIYKLRVLYGMLEKKLQLKITLSLVITVANPM